MKRCKVCGCEPHKRTIKKNTIVYCEGGFVSSGVMLEYVRHTSIVATSEKEWDKKNSWLKKLLYKLGF